MFIVKVFQLFVNPVIKKTWHNIMSLTLPESTTKRTPSMVTEVSAMFVDTIHFLTPSGGKSNTYQSENESSSGNYVDYVIV